MSTYKKVSVKELMQPSQEHIWEDTKVELNGWVCAIRVQGGGKGEDKGKSSFGFVSVMDNTSVKHMQVVMNIEKCVDKTSIESALQRLKKGAMLTVRGKIISCPSGNSTEQKTELITDSVQLYGDVDAAKYPMAKHKMPLESIRQYPHLRFKTKSMVAVHILRNKTSYLIHQFFQERGYHWAHTPLLTANDCEGAGETFQILTQHDKTILLNQNKLNDKVKDDKTEDDTMTIKDKIIAIKTSDTTTDIVEVEEVKRKRTFFPTDVYLSVSGQLHAEAFAHAFEKVYTYGPTFRADPSETSRHLAEFWMVEPEMAFCDLDNNMDVAENFIKEVLKYVINDCKEDLIFLNERLINEDKTKPLKDRNELNLIDRLNFVVNNDFVRINYTEAFEILRSSKPNKKKKFKYPVNEWGVDLQSEHERFLVEKYFKKPVIIYDYPAKIKAFYMRMNEDGKTVRAMDILFPGIGEIVGGSQREERLDVLKERISELNIDEKELWWYLDLRKYGTVKHSGFGLGLERLILFATGMTNIRDVIPFPRTPKNAEF